MGKEIMCVRCGERITDAEDLVIAGKLMHPFHRECFEEVKHTLPYRLAYPVNSLGFWITLLGINLVLAGIPLAFPGTWQDVRWFFLVANVPLLLFRGLAWLGFERHLR